MNDELGNTPETSIPSNTESIKKRPTTNCLDGLPNDAKMHLHSLIASGQGGIKCRTSMILKYAKSPLVNAVSVASKTYDRYIALRGEDISAAAEAQKDAEKAIVGGFKEEHIDLRNLAEQTFNSSNPVENKKQALITLFENAEKRRKLLESKQNGNFIDPHLEVLISQYMKEQRALVESLVTLQEELAKDADKELQTSFKVYTEMMLTQMIYSYKAVNGEKNLVEFKVELEKRYETVLNNWLKKMEGGSGN